jgi:alpha-galactosidase
MEQASFQRWFFTFLVAAICAPAGCLQAEVRHNASSQTWTLKSAAVEYQLHQHDGSVYLEFFGIAGQPPWKEPPGPPRGEGGRYDITGLVEGEEMVPADLALVSQEIRQLRPGVDELRLVFRHRRLPLEVEARYTTWGETGVLTRQLKLSNKGDRVLHVELLPSLAWRLPAGEYELDYLRGTAGHERQLTSEPLRAGRRAFVTTRGRSTIGYSPWFALHNRELGTTYLAQLAYSGNWQMGFEQPPDPRPLGDEDLRVDLGMRFDFGGALALRPGESFTLPLAAFTASAGDLDDAANQLHRFQRQYVIPRTPTNDPLLVQFNSWYPFPGKPTVDQMKIYVDLVAQLGAEVFVHDSGWYNKKDWSRELGDYVVNPAAYPKGLEELAQYVHSKGMKFGIWVEIENLGVESQTFKEHPDWVLTYNGRPLEVYNRYHLNFAKPEVRRWARSVVDRLVHDYQIEWLKIDYNIDIGEKFDPPGMERPGDVLYQHLMNYYAWLDEVRAAYPKLVIENCASGGTRFDLGIMGHTHTTWLSDIVRPVPSVQLGYGCTVEFIPEVCNHWMVGDKDDGEVVLSNPPGWWDFMLRVPMNGQYGFSSRVFDWSPEMKQHATDAVRLYKRLRQVIMGADVYHLTPPPAHNDPTGWSAIQYVSPDRKRSMVTVYRLAQSNATEALKLRGLDAERKYRVTEEGQPRGVLTGREVSTRGFPVKIDAEWRATVIELQAEP